MKNEMYKEMLDELVEAIFGMEEITEEIEEVRTENVYDILDDLYNCINLNDQNNFKKVKFN